MLPTLFLPHGSPLMLLHAGEAGLRLAEIAAELPRRPKAIVIATAHWNTKRAAVGSAQRPETIHDFWGFPDPLYELRYPAPGAPDLAGRVASLLHAAGFVADTVERGLDHGAWTPLHFMFPQADIPVVPLAIQLHLGPEYHYRLGQALAPLLADDILVIGSGNLTHNLNDVQAARVSGGGTPTYVEEFAGWMWRHIESGDSAALLDYRRRAPAADRAHPTEDHLLPLFVALGAAGTAPRPERLHTGVDFAVLAMDAYAFHPATETRQ